MEKKKRIAIKKDLIEWVGWNREILCKHELICTGTTGKLVENLLNNEQVDRRNDIITIKKLKSGPLGGDQQLGAMISEG